MLGPWPVCTTYTSKITGALLWSRPQYIMRILKNIIWFKQAFCTNSYFIGYFQYFSEQIMTHNFFKRYCSWYEAFPYLHIRDAGRSFQRRVLAHYSGDLGPLWMQSICTLQLLLGSPFENRAAYLYITVAVGGTFEGRALNYDSKILYERVISFLIKMRKIFVQNKSRWPLIASL